MAQPNRAQSAASPTNMDTTSQLHKPVCFLLDKTPPEIRNRIYEFVFGGHPQVIDLLQAQPPANSLITTCRQIHSEAKLLYQDAYRKYWTDTTFEFVMGEDPPARCRAVVSLLTNNSSMRAGSVDDVWIKTLRDEDVSHISSIRIEKKRPDGFAIRFSLKDGVWDLVSKEDSWHGYSVVLIPREYAATVDFAGFSTSNVQFVESYSKVAVREIRRSVSLPPLSGGEIKHIKKLARKDGLKKAEILALISWGATGKLWHVLRNARLVFDDYDF